MPSRTPRTAAFRHTVLRRLFFKVETLFLRGQESILDHFQPAPRKEQQPQNTHPFAKYTAPDISPTVSQLATKWFV